MLEINEERNGTQWVISLCGRLDTLAAAELDQVVQGGIAGVTELVFDFADVPYIASAGLRILLVAQKQMSKQGSMKLLHVRRDVKDVLEITGFINFLTLEETES